jgi:acetate kinase
MDRIILILNCGSSSVKYRLENWDQESTMAAGIVERVGIGGSFCAHELPGRDKITVQHDCPDHREAIKLVVATLTHADYGAIREMSQIAAVGHRVVHGGERFAESVVITPEVLTTFRELAGLAPLHNPPNILGIEAAQAVLPQVTHVAVMDTAWHQTMPAHTFTYALPHEWYEKYSVRRYGFHGTSLLYCAKRAAVLLGKNPLQCDLIICHIGNGVSLNAVKDGLSYDTSMGFTPLEGLVMGTRAGDHDPAIPLYVMDKEGMNGEQMSSVLNKKSGLLGITGRYTDRRDVEAAAKEGDRLSALAIDVECYRLKKYIGAYAAALGRVDAVIFTAGVGEMSPLIRARSLDGLELLGIRYSPEKNAIARTRNAECDITGKGSRSRVFVIPTDEERVLVEDTVALLEGRYRVHTEFSYTFQSRTYRNHLRDTGFKKDCLKVPALKRIAARPK